MTHRRPPAPASDPPDAPADERTEARDAFEDPRALAALRREVLTLVGEDYGRGVLYGMAFRQGMMDGCEVAQRFSGSLAGAAELAGSAIPLVFRPERGELGRRFAGTLAHCTEASVQAATLERAHGPSCFVSSGYSAGWYSALCGKPLLVRETHCAAMHPGATTSCRFEARSVEEWRRSDPRWVDELLPFLEYDATRASALREARLREASDSRGSMLGSFDPMSPAIHVWGSVIVIPYSGGTDGEDALEAIARDLGSRALEAAVLDLTGARLEGVERFGLLRLLSAIDRRGMVAVIAAAPPALVQALGADGVPALPLFAPDVTRAIALAFQLCPQLEKHS